MKTISDLDKAKHDAVHKFPGGAATIAPLLGIKNQNVLNNKVNPTCDRHHLTLDESLALQLVTGNHNILHAIARLLGYVVIDVKEFNHQGASDLELLDVWSQWHSETGETSTSIRNALADGKVSKQEMDEIRREVYEDFSREFELLNRLESIAED